MKYLISTFVLAFACFFVANAQDDMPRIIKDSITVDGDRYIKYITSPMVCSKAIEFVIAKDGTIHSAAFTKGCSGNTKGVCALVEGMKAEEAIARMEGIPCGKKPTSCPDQFAKALKMALGKQ